MSDKEDVKRLRAALERLGGAIMSVEQHNTDIWMEYIKDEIEEADAVLMNLELKKRGGANE